MRSGFLPARVVHLHPTRACNLACAHCYSESSPAARGAIAPERVLRGLRRLREQGYELLSLSGGEPWMYPALQEVVVGAASIGYRVHVITNGMLLTPASLAPIAEHLSLVGVSIDGDETVHNEVRGSPLAHRGALRGLEVLAEAEVPSALVYAVTARSLAHVPQAHQLALAVGARLLHLRPLAPEGRGRELTDGWQLTPADCARLYLLAELLGGVAEEDLHVQVDLVPTVGLAQAREQHALLADPESVEVLSDAVNPLVVDPEGRLLPFSWGIDPRLALGTLESFEPLAAGGPAHDGLVQLLRTAFDRAEDGPGGYLDWFAHLTEVSRHLTPLPTP